jgi:peptidoglycan-associated lipoprotein
MNNHAFRIFLASAALVVLGACSSGVKLNDQPPVTDNSTASGNGSDSRAVVGVTATGDDLNNPNSPLAKRSVYFDYDSFVVKDEYHGLVSVHARYLQTHPTAHIIIQGNTDERGGSEYNLALGQKRAEAVRKALSLSGVADTQVEAVSFGKEKPKALGHDEASWAENRRADIVYQ